MRWLGTYILAAALSYSFQAAAAEPVTKDELARVFVGQTIHLNTGSSVTLMRDGNYVLEKEGRVVSKAPYSLPSGNIVQIDLGPRRVQRDLFYKSGQKYFVVDRWGRRSDVVRIEPFTVEQLASTVSAPETGVVDQAAADVTSSIPETTAMTPEQERLRFPVQLQLEITPSMVDAAIGVLSESGIANDSDVTRAVVARMIRAMLASQPAARAK